MRLNRVVLPAPLGPITPSISPWLTDNDTSSMMRAPPICRPRCSSASTGWLVIFSFLLRDCLLQEGRLLGRGDRRSDGLSVYYLDQLRNPAIAIGDQANLEHRLENSVV